MDGTGLREIEDKSVAAALRDKVNAFKVRSAVTSAAIAAAYGAAAALAA